MAFPPQEPPDCITDIPHIRKWFDEFLGRPPRDDDDAIGYGRVGLPCVQVIDEIWNAQEAVNYRARKAQCEATAGMVWVNDHHGGACQVGHEVGHVAGHRHGCGGRAKVRWSPVRELRCLRS